MKAKLAGDGPLEALSFFHAFCNCTVSFSEGPIFRFNVFDFDKRVTYEEPKEQTEK